MPSQEPPRSDQPALQDAPLSRSPVRPDEADDALPGWKRSLDLLACLAALPVLILCTAILTLITKLLSPGPSHLSRWPRTRLRTEINETE